MLIWKQREYLNNKKTQRGLTPHRYHLPGGCNVARPQQRPPAFASDLYRNHSVVFLSRLFLPPLHLALTNRSYSVTSVDDDIFE